MSLIWNLLICGWCETRERKKEGKRGGIFVRKLLFLLCALFVLVVFKEGEEKKKKTGDVAREEKGMIQ